MPDLTIEAVKELLVEAGLFAKDKEQDPNTTSEFQTETVEGVEVAEVGVHIDTYETEWTATEATLDGLVTEFNTLAALGWRVPLRFGTHTFDDPSPLGLIALGWMKSVKRVGDKLVATLEKVPKVIAELIRKGGLPRISPGILFNLNVNGHKAPEAFDHLALLGVRVPAMLGLKSNDATPAEQIAAMYGATLEAFHTDSPEFTYEGAFEGGPKQTPPVAEGGSMGKTVELEALGVKDEKELKGKLELARQTEEANAAKTKAEGERDATKLELETERKTNLRARAVAFFETHKTRIAPKDREKFIQTWMLAAGQGSAEFESGEGDSKTKTTFTPLAVFETSVAAMPEVVKMDESGHEKHEDPREGKPTKDEDDDSGVVHADLTTKAEVRAKEILAEAKDAGEEMSRPSAFRQALLELAQGEEVEE